MLIQTNGHKNGHNGQKKANDPALHPHNVEAERAVLGALLIDPDSIILVSQTLSPLDFYIERHVWIYEVMLSLYTSKDQKPLDLLLISDELERREKLTEIGGSAYLSELINDTPSSIHAQYYAGLVYEASKKRQLVSLGGQIARLGFQADGTLDEKLDEAESLVFQVSQRGIKNGFSSIQKGLDIYCDRMEYLYQNKNKLVGLPTGLRDLDNLLGGLQRSDMVILAGRPGMGKTSLGLSIGLHAARKFNSRVGVFSLEMSQEQLLQRLVATESGIDSHRLRMADIKEDEWPAFMGAIEKLNNYQIFIDDTPAISVMELRSKARHLQAQHGLDLLIVDYLQLMRGDHSNENRTQEVSYISRAIKALARELNVPILALSQLSRSCESRHDKRPMLSDLRESGSLEQDADVVLFIYRDEIYNPDTEFPNIAEIILSKHRHGPTGAFSVYFKKHLTQFIDLELRQKILEKEPLSKDWSVK